SKLIPAYNPMAKEVTSLDAIEESEEPGEGEIRMAI
ncbi:unnamed protein product, partial [marine sediment metagenome]